MRLIFLHFKRSVLKGFCSCKQGRTHTVTEMICASLEFAMRSMRGGFIFRNRGPSLKAHHGQHLASMMVAFYACENSLQQSRALTWSTWLQDIHSVWERRGSVSHGKGAEV
jgi:hypothetical protein